MIIKQYFKHNESGILPLKVMCINSALFDSVIEGKTYMAIDVNNDDWTVRVRCEDGNARWLNTHLFITMKEHRHNKLVDILDV